MSWSQVLTRPSNPLIINYMSIPGAKLLKDLSPDEHLLFDRVQELKLQNKNSREVARLLNLSLEQVNNMWAACAHCQHIRTEDIIKS